MAGVSPRVEPLRSTDTAIPLTRPTDEDHPILNDSGSKTRSIRSRQPGARTVDMCVVIVGDGRRFSLGASRWSRLLNWCSARRRH